METINLIVKPSKLLGVLLLLMYAGAIICVACISMYLWLKLVLVAILFWRFVTTWQRHFFLKGDNAVVQIWLANNEWYLKNARGHEWQVTLYNDSIVTRYLIILNFKLNNQKRTISVPLFFDSLGKEKFRELRKHLLATRGC